MNKSELIAKVATEAKTTQVEVKKVLDAILKVIPETMKKGEDVTLVGFGTFKRTNRKARNGRNPQTGKTIKIPAKRVPTFKAGKEFKEIIK